MWKAQKEYLEKYYWGENTLRVMDILHLLSETLAKRQQIITYVIRVEVEAHIP